jgi:hypothetical protein
MNENMLAQDVFIFNIEPKVQRITGGIGNYQLLGDSHIFTPNEPNAIVLNYYLKEKAKAAVKITVSDPYGQVLQELSGKGEAGMNTVLWDMRAQRREEQAQRFPGGFGGPMVDPGEYVITLDVDGQKFTKKALIPKRMGWSLGPFPVVIK